MRSVGAIDSISARKFLDVAKNSEDRMVFYTVFRFFEQRNVRMRGNPRFAQGTKFVFTEYLKVHFNLCRTDHVTINKEQMKSKTKTTVTVFTGEHCEQYVRHFEDLFGPEAFLTAASV